MGCYFCAFYLEKPMPRTIPNILNYAKLLTKGVVAPASAHTGRIVKSTSTYVHTPREMRSTVRKSSTRKRFSVEQEKLGLLLREAYEINP